MIGAYIFQACDALDLDGPALLRRVDIADDVFAQAEPAISAGSYVKFWSVLAAATNRSDAVRTIGSLAGSSATNKMHLISYGSATTKNYLETLVHYGPLIAAPLSKLTYANGRFGINYLRDEICATTDFHTKVQMVALVETIRIATGQPVIPNRVMMREDMDDGRHQALADCFTELGRYFDVAVERGGVLDHV